MIRTRSLCGLFAMLCLLGFALQVGIAGLARAGEREGTGRPAPTVSRPYQRGPLETQSTFAAPDIPRGAKELLGLSMLAAILYGLRASGLARESGRP